MPAFALSPREHESRPNSERLKCGYRWLQCGYSWSWLGGSKDLSEDTVRDRLGLRGADVGVLDRGTDVGVPQRLLDEGEVRAVAEQVGGIRVFELVGALANHIDPDQFHALTEGIVDLLTLDTGRLACGKQVFGAVMVISFLQPSGQHQFLIQQGIDVLSKFLHGVIGAFATVAPDSAILHVGEAQAGNLEARSAWP